MCWLLDQEGSWQRHKRITEVSLVSLRLAGIGGATGSSRVYSCPPMVALGLPKVHPGLWVIVSCQQHAANQPRMIAYLHFTFIGRRQLCCHGLIASAMSACGLQVARCPSKVVSGHSMPLASCDVIFYWTLIASWPPECDLRVRSIRHFNSHGPPDWFHCN